MALRKTDILKDIWRLDSGAVAVEFGILVGLLLLLMVGSLEFGRLFYDHRIVTNGVRDAARYLARVDDPTDATNISNARNLAMRGSTSGSAQPLIAYWSDPTTVQISRKLVGNTTVPILEGGTPLVVIDVKADVPYTPQLSLVAFLGLGSLALHAQQEERWIGD